MSLNENLEAYSKLQDELIRKYHGKVAVFYRGKLVVIDKDLKRAIEKARQKTSLSESYTGQRSKPQQYYSGLMKSWNYLDDIPFIPVKLHGKKLSISNLALVDTGAKYCVIHDKLAKVLGLEKVDEDRLSGFGSNQKFTVALCMVDIEINGIKENVLSACVQEENYPSIAPKVILGRNLLNKFKITLDGKNKKIYLE